MLFDTPVYFVFLTLVVLLYWRLGWRGQNRFLLGASYFFYGWWDWRFLLLMLGSTAIDYAVALGIHRAPSENRRRSLFIFSLILNFAILGVFKYFNFFVDSFAGLLDSAGVHNIPRGLLQVVLPPGISFYTFQEVAYIVDVYHRKLEPADSLVEYGLFISLFPHLIAGPIQRPSHLLPQVQKPRAFHAEPFFDGCLLILSGLFRKCVIADQCANLANSAFDGRMGAGLWPLLIGAYAFAWQIYGDFSAYSDLARGSAQLLGFHFMVNFRQPYLATSLQDFWRRWHISLSTWLRDYLYIPLGGSRGGEARTYRNLLLTMLLGGLWHGANWTFVVWGAIHGTGLALERFFQLSGRTNVWLRRVVIFHIVCLAWIFFRAPSVTAAIQFIGQGSRIVWMPEYATALGFLALVALALFAVDLRLENHREEYLLQSSALLPRVAIGAAAAVMVLLFSAGQSNAFLYFQF